MLELIGLGHDPEAMASVARRLGGVAYGPHESQSENRPYSGLLRVATDDVEAVAEVADVALHVGFSRLVKQPPATAPEGRVIAAFGLARNPALTHREADNHWRDTHGPLALTHHAAMCDYTQLSILATLAGPALDGIALCAFGSRHDLSTRFFNDDDARAAIEADVVQFADPAHSPRRVILVELEN